MYIPLPPFLKSSYVFRNRINYPITMNAIYEMFENLQYVPCDTRWGQAESDGS